MTTCPRNLPARSIARRPRDPGASPRRTRCISVEDGIALNEARGTDLHALCLVADELRRQHVGDRVTYVVNRNINFTNVCIKNCKFCAFARTVRSEQGYFLPHEEIARRVRQAWEMGATEVCLAGRPLAESHRATATSTCAAW